MTRLGVVVGVLGGMAVSCGGTRDSTGSPVEPQFADPPAEARTDAASAPLVVIGVAQQIRSEWSVADQEIVTITDFEVQEVERGSAAGLIQIHTRGGVLDDHGSVFSHEARFQEGELARVFLTPRTDGTWTVVGGFLGKQAMLNPPTKPAVGTGVGQVSQAVGTCGSAYCFADHNPRYAWQETPIPYYINPNIPAAQLVGTQANLIAGIQRGFSAWEDDTGSAMEWVYMGTTTATSISGAWVVSFGVSSGGYTAATNFNWYTNSAGATDIAPGTITLNKDLCWRSDGVAATGCPARGSSKMQQDGTYYDVQHVAMHESGHGLGLDHVDPPVVGGPGGIPPDTSNVMFYAYSPRRTLGTGDLAGVRGLYPSGWSTWESAPVGNDPNALGLDVAAPYKGAFLAVTTTSEGYLWAKTRSVNNVWSFNWSSFDVRNVQFWTSAPSLVIIPISGSFYFPIVEVRGFDSALWGVAATTNPSYVSAGGQLAGAPDFTLYNADNIARGTDNKLWKVHGSIASDPPPSIWTKVNDQILTSDPKMIDYTSTQSLLVARGTSNELLTMWVTNGTYGGWSSLGGTLNGGPNGALRGSGRIDIVARGGANTLWTISYTASGWSGWTAVPGSPAMSQDPVATSWGSNRLDVFAKRASDSAYVHARLGQ